MVNEGEERYLRQSLLLLKGCRYIGLQVLHRVEQNEIRTTGKDLERVLRDKENPLRKKFSVAQQQEKLFPADGKTKCETWDIPIITGVLLKCFRPRLDAGEIEAVKTISYKRNGVAHTTTASLTEADYLVVCQDLKHAISILSGKSDQTVKDRCKELVDECLHGPLESQKQEVKNLPEYDSLFKEILRKIENTEHEMSRMRIDLTAMVKDALDRFTGDRVLKTVKVIDSELEVIGKENDGHNVNLAETIITTVLDEAIRRVGSASNVNLIRQAVDEILQEIDKTGLKVAQAEHKCVLIKLNCTSYSQIISLLNLLAEPRFQALLDRLADVLTQHLGLQHPVRLTFRISVISLRNLLKELDYQPAKTHKRSIRLPIQCETVEDVGKLWKFFEEGGAANGLKKLADALSVYLNTDISVKAQLNPEQVMKAIEDAEEWKSLSLTDKKQDFSASLFLGSAEEFVGCDQCDSKHKVVQANSFCLHCKENLCSDCAKAHKASASFIQHLHVDKAQSFSIKRSVIKDENKCTEVCEQHINEVIEYYCKDHSELGCKICIASKHSSCSFDYIPAKCFDVDNSNELKKTEEEIEQNLANLDAFEEMIKETKDENQRGLYKAIAELDRFREKINQRLDMLKERMVKEAENIQNHKSTTADKVADKYVTFYNSLKKIQLKFQQAHDRKQKAQMYIFMKQAQALLKDYDVIAYEKEIAMQKTTYVFQANKELDNILSSPDGLGKLLQQTDVSKSAMNATSKEVNPETYTGSINVRTPSDQFKCSITGCDILPEDRVLLVDNKNKKVKILDIREREVVEELELHKEITLHDVAVLPNHLAFVTNPREKKVIKLRTSGRLSVTDSIKLDRECYGITYNQDTVFIVCWKPFSVLVLELDGTIEKDISFQSASISNPKYIAADNARGFLFVSGENCVVSVNLADESKYMSIETLLKPQGLSVLEDDSVVACSPTLGSIYRISASLKQIKVLKNNIPRAQSICYNKDSRQVCVGCWDSDNMTFFVRDKKAI